MWQKYIWVLGFIVAIMQLVHASFPHIRNCGFADIIKQIEDIFTYQQCL